jgi:hypothetical protein
MNRQNGKIVFALWSLFFACTWVAPGSAQTVTGSGTTNRVPKFTGTSVIGDSEIYQSGTSIGIGTTAPALKLHVNSGAANSAALFESTDPTVVICLKDNNTTALHGGLALGRSGDDLRFYTGGSDVTRMIINASGQVGIGTGSPTEALTVKGNILVQRSDGTAVMELGEGLDFAEGFEVAGQGKPAPGSVLVIDAANPGQLATTATPYDSRVAGIVAGAKNIGSAVRLGVGQFDCNVAMAGRVYCNVEATDHAIQPGDLLTTSATPGFAMKATDRTRTPGAVLGKAMESLEKGQKGQILVLVTLQ